MFKRLAMKTVGTCVGLLFVFSLIFTTTMTSVHISSKTPVLSGPHPDTLVMYAFSDTDAEYTQNLRYFVAEASRQGDDSDYLFIINTDAPDRPGNLPSLLALNARYVFHRNECYDWGSFGWAMSQSLVDTKRYRYFVFMNSSVRGPFMPAYVKGTWTKHLVSMLDDSVKLVGPTISCEPAKSRAGDIRFNPHVQSYVVATDRTGLAILLDSPVFECRSTIQETIFHSEIGVSKAILDAGFNIAALMTRYRGVDWRDQGNWNCNAKMNPYGHHANDGATLEAAEVMFVKLKSYLLDRQIPYMAVADRLSKHRPLAANDYVARPMRYKLPGSLAALARGPECFDCEHYRASNADLPARWRCADLFNPYVTAGLAEGRKARYTCAFDESKVNVNTRYRQGHA